MIFIVGMIVALALGIYIGLGLPGMPGGREDRVVRSSRARERRETKKAYTPLDWLRPPKIRR